MRAINLAAFKRVMVIPEICDLIKPGGVEIERGVEPMELKPTYGSVDKSVHTKP